MRNAMFFPNRILYREELLSTTVTYAIDLDEAELRIVLFDFFLKVG